MTRISLSRMPARNLAAHPVRTAVLVLLAFAQAACVFGGAALAGAAQRDLSLANDRLGADAIVYPYGASYHLDLDELVMVGTPVAAYAPRSDLSRVDDCEGIAAVTHQVYVPGPSGGPSWIVGFDVETDFALAPWIEEGRDFKLPAGCAMTGADVGAETGSVEVYGRTWPVSAHLGRTGSAFDDAVFLGMGDLRAVVADASAAGVTEVAGVDPVSDYSALLVRAQPGADVEGMANWLNLYVRKAKTVAADAALSQAATGIAWQSAVIGGLAAAAWLVLLAAMSVAQSMALRERAGELFVWRVSGASRKAIGRTLVLEAMLGNAAGALIGVLGAAAAVAFSGNAPPLGTGAAIGPAAVALSALAGWAATALAVRRVMESSDGQMLVAA